MIAVSAHKPTAADMKRLEMAKKIWLKFDKMLVPGIVLEVRVRHEGGHGLKDGAGEDHPLAIRVQRHPRLERQDQIAEDEHHGVENEQGRRYTASSSAGRCPGVFRTSPRPARAGIFRP